MVEPFEYFGIGFLVAALLSMLLVVPLAHNRGVRLTTRRFEAQRFEAATLTWIVNTREKEQLRAEFATLNRQFELDAEAMNAKATTQLAELGRKSYTINQLREELGQKNATFLALESRGKNLQDQVRATEEEIELKIRLSSEAKRALAESEAKFAKLLTELDERSITIERQSGELVELRKEVETLTPRITDSERAVKITEECLAHERAATEAVTKELVDARSKVDGLVARTGELERQLSVQIPQVELFGRRTRDLETRLGEHDLILIERNRQIDQMRAELEAARESVSELRNELATCDRLRSDIAQREAQLIVAIEEGDTLRRKIGPLKRDAQSNWAAERVENAILRESIIDAVARMVSIIAILEGPGSPIVSLLAGPPSDNALSAIGKTGQCDAAPLDPHRLGDGAMADRIRAGLSVMANRFVTSDRMADDRQAVESSIVVAPQGEQDFEPDPDRRIAELSLSIYVSPNNAHAYRDRGVVYARKGYIAYALSDLDRAISLDNKDAYAYYVRGYIRQTKNEIESAIADFDTATELDPANADRYREQRAKALSAGLAMMQSHSKG
jgi:tetratricopeptide (TPR) repeat protein